MPPKGNRRILSRLPQLALPSRRSGRRTVPFPGPDPALLVSAVKLLRTAIGNGEQPDDDELHDLHEAVTFAMFRLIDWLDAAGSMPIGAAPECGAIFDALDGATFVREAILAGINPTGSKRVSPVKGTLRLCIKCIETALEEAGDAQPSSSELSPFDEWLMDQHARVSELVSLLERLDADDDTPMCMAITVREARELEESFETESVCQIIRAAKVGAANASAHEVQS